MINATKIIDYFQYSEYLRSERYLSISTTTFFSNDFVGHTLLGPNKHIYWVRVHYHLHCINNFLPYYAYASSEESGKLHVY